MDKYHNEDIAACTYDACKLKLKCLRWQLGTNKDPYQTYFDGSTCERKHFIDNKDYVTVHSNTDNS